jgi:tRNA 2-thiouridine synthesizing protein A
VTPPTEVVVVDALGTFCPVPVRLAARRMARLPPGALIELLADDPLVAVDVPAWCHTAGHTLESHLQRDGVWIARIRRGE